LPKGGITPLWPPAHRTSGPEGKEGQGEIFRKVCLLYYGLLGNSEDVIPAKAGIQVEKTGFPRIKYGASLSSPE